ncbi:MAG: hypothetical protein EOP06_26860, partial [Proteobacteria bacterium]
MLQATLIKPTTESIPKPFGFQIEPLPIMSGSGFVVRDDLLIGGTKQRAIIPFITELRQQGYDNFFYASPFCGFAQIALATAVQLLGVECTIYCEKAPTGGMHRFSA